MYYGSSNQIRLGCFKLKRVLPEKSLSDTGEIIQAAFEVIYPGRCNSYTEHPVIKKYLEETTLNIFACRTVKRQQNDFRSSSAHIFQINASKTWFGHGTINCMDSAQVETFFRSEEASHC